MCEPYVEIRVLVMSHDYECMYTCMYISVYV